MDLSITPDGRAFERESEYQAALERLKKPSRPALTALLLIGSLAAFLFLQRSESSSVLELAILVGVLLFHELGHLAGMLAFGYRDVKMFFIPFLGAAVSGRRDGAEAWKEGVMLLLGPLPGIAVGAAIALTIRTGGPHWLRALASVLLVLNGFNLLPLAALDGGKVLQLTLFARHLALEVAFLVVAGLGLLAFSLRDGSNKALWYGSLFLLMSIPFRYKLLQAAQRLRGQTLAIPSDPRALEGEAGHAVFLAAREAIAERHRGNARTVAGAMEQLVDLVARKLPGLNASAALIASWAGGIALAAGGFWLLQHGPTRWREVSPPQGGWSISFPDEPRLSEKTVDQPGGVSIRYTALRLDAGAQSYVAEEYRIDPAHFWQLDEGARDFVTIVTRGGKLRHEKTTPIEVAGRAARELTLSGKGISMRVVIVVDGLRKLHLVAASDGATERGEQFLASLKLEPAAR